MSHQRIQRSDDLRAENRFRVLSALRTSGSSTRAELGDSTGLSAAAVSTLTTAMLAEGLLQASPHATTTGKRRGRPQTLIAIAGGPAVAITILLTIDRLQITLIDYNADELSASDTALATRRLTASGLIDAVTVAIDTLLPSELRPLLRHIGIGFQGMTDAHTGTLLWSPILDVRDVPIADALSKHYGVPVKVQSDCRLIAEAIHHRDHRQLGDSFLTILFDHGIGLGLYLDGKAISGNCSSAMEFGHIPFEKAGARCRCGRQGCIEAYAADYGIVRQATHQTHDAEPPGRVEQALVEQIVRRAEDGDVVATAALNSAGTAIGRGLSMLFLLFDPMPVAFVGHTTSRMPLMLGAMQDALNESQLDAIDLEKLVHVYDNELALMRHGVALESLTTIDRQLADAEQIPALKQTQGSAVETP